MTENVDPPEESVEARRARAAARQEAQRIKRESGWAFVFPRWYRIPRFLPRRGELLGSLHAEWRSCSDEDCPCREGEKVHGPYWYRHYRTEEGRQRKRYVKRSDVERVRKAIQQRRARVQIEREKRREHMRLGKYARKRKLKRSGAKTSS